MRTKKKFLLPVLLLLVSLPLLWLLCSGVKMWFHLDFTQSYRSVPGVQNIVFWDNWQKQAYTRTLWGLKKTEEPAEFPERDPEAQRAAIAALEETIDCENSIEIAIDSPDGKQILYLEIEYNYYQSDMTDDEYCYYRVFDIETGQITTIYQGYREWFRLAWR